MTHNSDEFSFPMVTESDPSFPSSPSLWRVPSAEQHGGDGDGEKMKKSVEEEKMDMLWENFNDELHYKKEIEMLFDSDDMVQLCCVQALKMSKNSSTMLSPRKPNLVIIVKVLKKLFLLHNSHSHPKTRR